MIIGEINITIATIAKTIPVNFFRVDGLRRLVYLASRKHPVIAEGPKKIKYRKIDLTVKDHVHMR